MVMSGAWASLGSSPWRVAWIRRDLAREAGCQRRQRHLHRSRDRVAVTVDEGAGARGQAGTSAAGHGSPLGRVEGLCRRRRHQHHVEGALGCPPVKETFVALSR